MAGRVGRLLGFRPLGEHLLDDGGALHEHADILRAHQLDLFLAQPELDQTTALRGALAGLAGGRLARTNVLLFE